MTVLVKHRFLKGILVYLILAGISFILAVAMKGEKLVGWKVVLSFSVLSVVLILFATIMKIQLNFLIAEVANLGKFFLFGILFYDQYQSYCMINKRWADSHITSNL